MSLRCTDSISVYQLMARSCICFLFVFYFCNLVILSQIVHHVGILLQLSSVKNCCVSITDVMGFLEQCRDDQLESICKGFGTNITLATIQQDVQSLKEWLEKQPHLPNVTDEKLLRVFFLRCKGSLERTKNTLELYYVHKARMPSIFANRDPTTKSFKDCFQLMVRLPLPKLVAGSRVMIIYTDPIDDKDLQNISSDEILRHTLTSLLITVLMSGNHKSITVIIDSKNLSPRKVSLLVSIFRDFTLLGDMFARIEMIYVLNVSALMEVIIMAGRELSKKLFQERLTIWKKGEKDLVDIIPRENLPYEYGGTLGSRDKLKELCLKEMACWKGWLDDESKYVADLSKLPEDKKQLADITDFGMEGSFRKLNLE